MTPHAIAGMSNPALLHGLLDTYNWDDGFDVPLAIASNPACELATAIRLFWLADGGYWFEHGGSNPDQQRLCRMILTGIEEGRYAADTVAHDEELTAAQQHKHRKAGMPEILLRAVLPGMND